MKNIRLVLLRFFRKVSRKILRCLNICSPRVFLERDERIGGLGGWRVSVIWHGLFYWDYNTSDIQLQEGCTEMNEVKE